MTVDHSSKRSGEISVEARHIFPIIRKWLYSDEDIFVRELVSNASDAIRDDDLSSRLLRMVNRLNCLRHDTVVRCNDEDRDVRRLGA